MDKWWQGAFSRTPEGLQVVWQECAFLGRSNCLSGGAAFPWQLPGLCSCQQAKMCTCERLCVDKMCVSVYAYTYVVLYSWAGMHEVTSTYIMHKIPHRNTSWNQLPIIVPDTEVHPQPQRWATGAEIQEISTESCQSCVAKTQKVFLFHLWYFIHMTTSKVNTWGRSMARRTTFACLKLGHFPFWLAAPVPADEIDN